MLWPRFLRLLFERNENRVSDECSDRFYSTIPAGLLNNTICETQQEVELIQKALNKISKLSTNRQPSASAAGASNAASSSSSVKQTGQQHRKTMRRGLFMTMLQQKANQLPVWTGSKSEQPPPLTGTVAADGSYICNPGEDVAALCDGVEDDNWILAEVYLHNNNTNKYQVNTFFCLFQQCFPTPVDRIRIVHYDYSHYSPSLCYGTIFHIFLFVSLQSTIPRWKILI